MKVQGISLMKYSCYNLTRADVLFIPNLFLKSMICRCSVKLCRNPENEESFIREPDLTSLIMTFLELLEPCSSLPYLFSLRKFPAKPENLILMFPALTGMEKTIRGNVTFFLDKKLISALR